MQQHRQQHHQRHGAGHHPHHLSAKVLSADHEGWAEGIASLTEEHTATQLLADDAGATLGLLGRKVRRRGVVV